ncbi:hypothetical protein ABPG75_001199 [Micractinium tetrahymenae]
MLTNAASFSCSNCGRGISNTATIKVQRPISLVATAVPDASPITAGATAGFTFNLTNDAADAATGVRLLVPLPSNPGLAWTLTKPAAGCSIAGRLLRCGPARLAPGASLAVRVQSPTTAGSAGVITAAASFSCDFCTSGTASASIV